MGLEHVWIVISAVGPRTSPQGQQGRNVRVLWLLSVSLTSNLPFEDLTQASPTGGWAETGEDAGESPPCLVSLPLNPLRVRQ